MFTFPILLTIYAGFTHAFEADHLLAVSNIVSHRNKLWHAVKDGIYWGLGHSSTIIIIGILMILFKVVITENSFHYFEALVGVMLIILAVYRIYQFIRDKKIVVHSHGHSHLDGTHKHLHLHLANNHNHQHKHTLAYGVGLVHGLAGSGVLIIAAMSQINSPIQGIWSLIIFCAGCISGMLVAAGLFSVPFSKKIISAPILQALLIIATSLLCFIYGGKVIYQNLFI